MIVIFVLYFLSTLTCTTDSARILGVYPFPSYSHYQLGDRILKELARKGHEVTVISPYEEKQPIENFKQVLLDDLVEKAQAMKASLFDQSNYNIIKKVFWIDGMGLTFTELTLNHTKITNFLKNRDHFDLVIYQQFVSDAYSGFCHHFNAHCIAITAMPVPGWINRKVGNPGPPSYVPQFFVHSSANMNFLERFYNTFVYILTEISHNWYFRPKQNELLQKYFPNPPHLDDLYYNNSLVFVNSHISINDVHPVVPSIIHIGGYHVKAPKELPTDLKGFIDDAKDGVIFFSMGSNLKSKDFPISKRDAVLKVFSKLKQKVLWKWEDDTLPNKPENVKIKKWLPQLDILAHPNVVLFITHGGLLSTIEALYHGVPVLGIPVFADQRINMVTAELAGYGKYVPYETLTEENFQSALDDILSNIKYSQNAKERSAIFHDQPLKPLDNAIFWIEYVIRHGGAPHLKSAALNLSWYQYLLLDVILAMVVTVAVIVLLVASMCCKLYTLCCSKKKKDKKKNKKKKQ